MSMTLSNIRSFFAFVYGQFFGEPTPDEVRDRILEHKLAITLQEALDASGAPERAWREYEL